MRANQIKPSFSQKENVRVYGWVFVFFSFYYNIPSNSFVFVYIQISGIFWKEKQKHHRCEMWNAFYEIIVKLFLLASSNITFVNFCTSFAICDNFFTKLIFLITHFKIYINWVCCVRPVFFLFCTFGYTTAKNIINNC